MSEELNSWSEEDLRTKVISQWLTGHGFSWSELLFEFSFTIQLGRSRFEVRDGRIGKIGFEERLTQHRSGAYHPRADVLVRDIEGRNLLIIEAKAPREPLDDEARDQGISYARSLIRGNIAPFVVVTNGRETRIYDSLTKERLDGTVIPTNHPHVRAGFRISGDDIALRAEALTVLISLSPDNLNCFCQAQVERRMGLLRSTDLHSGKKYIPSLYVERLQAKHKLNELLDEQRRPVVLLIGPPQVGKTNFMCHAAEERLARGEACLFYPAVGMREGLLAEIANDFEWVLGVGQSSHRQIITRLRNVLRRTSQRLAIFIDGWNEVSVGLAEAIDQESELVCHDEIQIVISVTSTSLKRLLIGEAGNPSFIAQAAALDPSAIQLLGISPDADQQSRRRPKTRWLENCPDISPRDHQWSVISLPRYSEDEMYAAYEIYAKAFNVTVPQTHEREAQPYTLGITMRLFQHGVLPDRLDEPELMETHITDKLNRVVAMKQYDTRAFLPSMNMISGTAGFMTSSSRRSPDSTRTNSIPSASPGSAPALRRTATASTATPNFSMRFKIQIIMSMWTRLCGSGDTSILNTSISTWSTKKASLNSAF